MIGPPRPVSEAELEPACRIGTLASRGGTSGRGHGPDASCGPLGRRRARRLRPPHQQVSSAVAATRAIRSTAPSAPCTPHRSTRHQARTTPRDAVRRRCSHRSRSERERLSSHDRRYREPDRRHARQLMAAVIDCLNSGVPKQLVELARLGRTLKKRAVDVLTGGFRPRLHPRL